MIAATHSLDGLDALAAILAICAVFYYSAYWLPWKREDEERRRDRMTQRRLEEMEGRWNAR